MKIIRSILGVLIGYSVGLLAQGPITSPQRGPIVQSSGGGSSATAANCCLGTTLNYTGGVKVVPSADGTSAWTFTKADGTTAVLTLDTTNRIVGITANGSSSSPSIKFTGQTNTGLYAGTNAIGFAAGGTDAMGITNIGAEFRSDTFIRWNSAGGLFGTRDTGIARNTSGVVEVNNGTAGTLADIIIKRELMAKGSAGGTATAPGATNLRLEVACGSTAGSAALIVYAGTSTVALTVTNNIGTGVTGC